jgi:YHS domain-containing protein
MLRLLAYLFEFVIVVIIGRLLNRAIQFISRTPQNRPASPRSAPGSDGEPQQSGQTARDPVCGMFVSTELSHKLNDGTQTLHFCSSECLERYRKKAASA